MTATLPTSTTGHHQFIPLHKLTPSPLNHRKTFPKDKMAELAASISVKGVIQPIIARPLNGDAFEVVAGERRFRASKAAGLVDIPAIVRELTDTEALELQVIENGQREDPHPLEEAEGYEALMQCKNSAGEKYTVEQLADKVGKSKGYIYARLKLTALCPEGRKAFYAGELDASRALLIARIGHHDTQRQALKDVTQGRWANDGPMSYREAHQHILKTYMLVLKDAPFDIKDEQLLPKAGACGPCPKRTGNQADLFGDVKNADVCTDPKCFDDKRQAHYSVAVKELQAKGHKVISGAAAKKIIPRWDDQGGYSRDQVQGGYAKLEDHTYASGRHQKVKEFLGADFEPALLQHPGTGEIIKVATQQAIAAAAQKAKKQPAREAKTGRRDPPQRKKTPAEIFEDRLFTEIFKKLPEQLGKPELQVLAGDVLMNTDGPDLVANELVPRKDGKKHDWQSGEKALKAALPKMSTGELARLVVGLAIKQQCYNIKQLTAVATRYKVDPAKVKKAIADEEKAAATAKASTKGADKLKKAKK